MDTKKKVTEKMEAKMSNGIPNGDSRSPKFPEDAKYDDIYWYIFFIFIFSTDDNLYALNAIPTYI